MTTHSHVARLVIQTAAAVVATTFATELAG
jgi:hypothetical protein